MDYLREIRVSWCHIDFGHELWLHRPFVNRNPTPDGVKMMEGIPKFLPITEEDDNYMEIDEEWTIKYNFSLTYTATLDEMKEHNGDSIAALKYN